MRKHISNFVRLIPHWWLLAVCSTGQVNAQYSFTAVATAGQQAPNQPAGVKFSQFSEALLDDKGHVTFLGYMSGPGITPSNNSGLWTGPQGDQHLMVRAGDTAPGTGGAVFTFFAKPVPDGDGGAFFAAAFKPASPGAPGETGEDAFIAPSFIPPLIQPVIHLPRQSTFLEREYASLCKEVKDFDPKTVKTYYTVEATGGVDFYLSGSIQAFQARQFGEKLAAKQRLGQTLGAPVAAFALDSEDETQLVAVAGAPAPSLASTLTSVDETALAPGGFVAFTGTVNTRKVLFTGTPETLTPMFLPDTPVAESLKGSLGAGTVYEGGASGLGLNAAREISCITGVSTGKTVLLAGPVNELRRVAETRGAGSGEGFTFLAKTVINPMGDVSFTAYHSALTGSRRGLWTEHGHGPPVRKMAEGTPGPGLPDGRMLAYFQEGPFANRLGHTVMAMSFGTDLSNTEGRGLWVADRAGTRLVARDGQTITVSGQSKTISQVSILTSHGNLHSGGQDGSPTILNVMGEVVFQANFTDGTTSIVVATPAAGTETFAGRTQAAGLTGPAASPLADPDADGFINLTEVAFGSSPADPESVPVLPEPQYVGAHQRVYLTVPKPLNLSGITYQVQQSSDLIQWTGTGVGVRIENGAMLQAYVPAGPGKVYLRVAVSL